MSSVQKTTSLVQKTMSPVQTGPVQKISRQQYVERVRSLGTILNLHFAGLALLALINLYLLAQLGFTWNAARSQDAAAVAQQTLQMQTAEKGAQPLRGLDGKLTRATASADGFYGQRLPYAASQVYSEVGALAKKQGIKLTRLQYAYSPVLDGSVGAVTQVRMDASLTGEYRPLVVFINSLERDHLFFFISGVTLNGQQSGTVSLRIRLTTYLRAPVGDEASARVAPADDVEVSPIGSSEVSQ